LNLKISELRGKDVIQVGAVFSTTWKWSRGGSVDFSTQMGAPTNTPPAGAGACLGLDTATLKFVVYDCDIPARIGCEWNYANYYCCI